MKIVHLAPIALAIVSVTACSEAAAPLAEEGETTAVGQTLGELVAGSSQTSALASAIERTGMSGVFEGAGGYTVLAPPNAAFDPLAAGNSDDGKKAIVAAILRDHILPGQLELSAISKAIDENGGKVTVATVGSGTVEFTKDGDTISARLAGSDRSVKLTGSEQQATNGSLIEVDQLLVLPPPSEQLR